MKAKELYHQIICNFDHILLGSQAINLQLPKFREPSDYDIKIPRSDFLLSYLRTREKELNITVEDIHDEGYHGLLSFRIKCEDGLYIDVIDGEQEFIMIGSTKVATLQSVIENKKRLLDHEVEKPEPRLSTIIKHYKDINLIKQLTK